MATSDLAQTGVRSAVPYLVAMVLWIVVTLVVYGGWLVVWPDVPGGEPWVHLGVYILPVIGYAGHVLGLARADVHY